MSGGEQAVEIDVLREMADELLRVCDFRELIVLSERIRRVADDSAQAREREAAAWFDGYAKGDLDGYFGTRDERAKSPYADLDPYREQVTPPGATP